MEKVVLGVDADGGSAALEWVILRASTRSTQVHLVRAFDMLIADPDHEGAMLDSAADAIRARSPETVVERSLVTVSIPAALLDAAAEADLLVMGAHAQRPVASMLTGSVPLEVAARSSSATVIVPDGWTPSPRRTIVVGVDRARTSDRAVLFAAREAQDAGAELEVVHAWTVSVPDMTARTMRVDASQDRAIHRATLAASLDRIHAAFPRVRLRGVLEQRMPGVALTDDARHGRLLVLGSHRWGPITGLILGSTARAALRRATAPLCIVPPTAHEPLDALSMAPPAPRRDQRP